jgi:hypothetical protein
MLEANFVISCLLVLLVIWFAIGSRLDVRVKTVPEFGRIRSSQARTRGQSMRDESCATTTVL